MDVEQVYDPWNETLFAHSIKAIICKCDVFDAIGMQNLEFLLKSHSKGHKTNLILKGVSMLCHFIYSLIVISYTLPILKKSLLKAILLVSWRTNKNNLTKGGGSTC